MKGENILLCYTCAYKLNKHTFNGLFSGTTWVSQYQKYIIIRDFNKARDDGVWDSSGTGEHICNMHCELEDEMSTNKL